MTTRAGQAGATSFRRLANLVVPRNDPATERRRDGRLAGVLYLVAAGYALLVTTQVPEHRPAQLALAALIVVLGGTQLVLPWGRLPRAALHLPMGVAIVFLCVAYGGWLGQLSHWGPAYTLAFGYVGLTLGPTACARWGLVALAGLAGAVTVGRQHEHVLELAAAIAISALVGELVAAAVAVQVEHARDVRQLHGSLSTLLEAEELTGATALISEEAGELLRADGVVVLLREQTGGRMFGGAGGWGLGGAGYAEVRIDVLGEHSAAGEAVTTARVKFLPEISRSLLVTQHWAERLHAASVLYIPIIGRDEVIGVMVIWWSKPLRSLDSFAEQVTRLLSVQAAPVLERLRRMQDLDRAALTDPLTGVGNRRAFEQALAELPRDAALIICDLDRFKVLNDTRGHAAGDRVLRQFAAAASSAVRTGDVVARIGGDEFALVLNGGRAAADAVLARLATAWDNPDDVGFSAGSAVRRPGEEPAALSERADQALYDAKRATHRS